MRINNNIPAMNTHRILKMTNGYISKSMEKLSSGLRINKAADDAAGMSISEKMRAQIRGLHMASKNSSDGISLIQTAECGLGEIQNPNLQRMRELVIQALNEGTLTQQDKDIIQNEIDEIKNGIDDIANNTEFNTTKVLRPPVIESPGEPPSGMADIVFLVDNTGSMGPKQQAVADNLSNFIDSIKSKGVTDIKMGVMIYYDDNYISSSFSGSEWTSNEDDIKNALTSLTNSGGTENVMTAASKVISDYNFRENMEGISSKHIILVTDEDSDDVDNVDDVNNVWDSLKDNGIKFHSIIDPNYDSNSSGIDEFDILTTGTSGESLDIKSSNWGEQLTTILGESIGESAGPTEDLEEMPTLQFQIGPNSGDVLDVELFDFRTPSLGINNILIDPMDEAEKSLVKIDSAIALVSSHRSRFGAYQNRLEHTVSNLDNSAENLQAAESRIRDVDMADEISKLSKNQILLQASQSMLAQTNQMTQGVLQLLG